MERNFEEWFKTLPEKCSTCEHCIPLTSSEVEDLNAMGIHATDLCTLRRDELIDEQYENTNDVNLLEVLYKSSIIYPQESTCENYSIDDFKIDLLWQQEIANRATLRYMELNATSDTSDDDIPF